MLNKLPFIVNRVTPDIVNNISPNQVFVFGSNLAGRHGKGAAKTALRWGAKWGCPKGLSGNTYAIPTKDFHIRNTLAIEQIRIYVDEFIDFAITNKEYVFLVTEIGCGLAKLDYKDVAPLFARAIEISNIHLPINFWKELLKD